MKKLRVGLVGCGGMGMNVARRCNELENADVVAVCDMNEENAKKAAEELDAKVFTSYPKLLASDIDGVIIATPNDLHASMAVAAAEKKKHIFTEKPMALTVADCRAMVAAAKKARVKLVVGQVLRLMHVYWKAAQIIKSGELGAPFAISVVRIGKPDGLKADWRITRKHAGGILFEVNVHELDFMRHIMGEAESVYANTGHFTNSHVEYEDYAATQIKFRTGGVGLLQSGTSAVVPQHGMIIHCEKGTMSIGGSAVRYTVAGGEEKTIEAAKIEKEDAIREEVGSWVNWILKRTPPVVYWRDGMAAVELAEAAYRSAANGKAVKLPLRG
jgi:UDP-N-acetylglucosamine 3-dehydrogenase